MEFITRNVRDLDTGERRSLENVLGQQLEENQQVLIQIVTLTAEPKKNKPEETAALQSLPEWCNVFSGLNESEVAEVENVIRQRADLSRCNE